MFLLFRNSTGASKRCPQKFTFQYVSIISLGLEVFYMTQFTFTFQYVSIISKREAENSVKMAKFTFQYVSIISRLQSSQ